jgi:MATE family multidrug resistance protein
MAYWYRRVFLLAIPLILSNLTQPLLSTVDTILSGHLPGAAALGGVAIGGIFFNSVFWTFGFLRLSTTGLVAQAYGAQDQQELRLHFARAFLSAAAIGALLLAVRGPLVAFSIQLLGAGPAVAQNAAVYCNIRIWSAPAALANYVILGSLLGRQRARTALAIQAAINVVNVAVALLLVLRFHWGVAGIATATMLSDYAGLLLGLAITIQTRVLSAEHATGEARGRIRLHELLHGPSLRHLFALSRDLLIRTLSMVAAYAWFTRAGARQGDVILAANAVLLNMHMIASYGLDGFANAAEALVGQSLGARRLADYRAVLRVHRGSRRCCVADIAHVLLLRCRPRPPVHRSGTDSHRRHALPALGNRHAYCLRVGFSTRRRLHRRHAWPRLARFNAHFVPHLHSPGRNPATLVWRQRPVVRNGPVHGSARRNARFPPSAH